MMPGDVSSTQGRDLEPMALEAVTQEGHGFLSQGTGSWAQGKGYRARVVPFKPSSPMASGPTR